MNDELIADLASHTDRWHDDPDHDGVQWRLDVEADQDSHINDYDSDGKTSKYAYRYTDRESREPRPDGFTGAARKIEVDRGLWVWWQPADDMVSAKRWGGDPAEYPAVFAKYLAHVTELLQSGFCWARLHRRTTCECCGLQPELDASLGGIDTWPYDDQDYWQTIVSDLASEIEADVAEGALVPTNQPPIAPPQADAPLKESETAS